MTRITNIIIINLCVYIKAPFLSSGVRPYIICFELRPQASEANDTGRSRTQVNA